MKTGLFFGSFNPIHVGHLIIANTVAQREDIDEVWFIVSPQNPFKKRSTLLHEFDRFDMVEAAIEDNDLLKASNIEFNMPKPSYTIDTLTYLSTKHPNKSFNVIVGSDNLSHFHKWKNYEQILDEYGLLVYPRPNTKPHKFENDSRIVHVDSPMVDISATFIRNSIQNEKSIRYLVPDKVQLLIDSRKYYH
ncbi:nicotinate (nicotinamide) nucleotide adenylyltransferase [Aureibacter tunicatorum]|uniref:Probable nicotinate-nucleotide adenylyltransferase n=1 Tax=Aureibacter tunicatorum TaxID=866807 RepID=A0AAE3XJN0_9BACT|nr:nicotinate (nicotinamide) nucleotide adenylyltransferase [Aureibacter tunicatorum]MDR6237858.1 nicotinate-nucleotide adenylyltransferase [Aureibacter tunicatorum]BDD02893.1 putative nicotinate-nucleotide adenylyltransferase [Aureibacter tunicatorum]